MKTISLNQNVDLHIHRTEQFKDVTIRIELLTPFNRANLAARMMLDYLLSDTCQAYPTKDAAQRISDMLYGATFSGRTTSRGCADLYEFTSACVDGAYVKDPELFEQQAEFMSKFVFRPLAKDGRFDDALFEECRKKLLILRGLFNDQPSDYAVEQAALAYGGFYGQKGLPTEAEIQSLQNETVYSIYTELLKTAAVDIFVLGNVDETSCEKIIRRYFDFAPRAAERNILYCSHRSDYVEKIDHRTITQSSLILLYDTNRNYIDPLQPAFMLGNGILGGLPTSFLFQEIREKEGLCYSIGSENEPYDGILMISADVECGKEAAAEALAKQQVKRLQAGDFDDQLLNTTCSMYCDSWRSSRDGVRSLIWDDYRSVLLKRDDTIEEHIRMFQQVTREDIMNAWKEVELKVSYHLEMEEGAAHESDH